MSHEICTPINAIINRSEQILLDDITASVRENAQIVKQSGLGMLSLVNDISDISKIESGKLALAETDYVFASLIDDVESITKNRIAEKPLQFVVDYGEHIPHDFHGDAAHVRQVLLNLLSNAVKYTHEGHISLNISCKPAGDGLYTLIFEITDTGIGIRPEDMDNLFGEFSQPDQRIDDNVEGMGIGLVIARSLCRMMGGDVKASSRYGVGSTFTATLTQQASIHLPIL
jgi:signal transduction histidine kinase